MRKDKFLALAASIAFGLGVIVGGNNNAFAASGEKSSIRAKAAIPSRKAAKTSSAPTSSAPLAARRVPPKAIPSTRA